MNRSNSSMKNIREGVGWGVSETWRTSDKLTEEEEEEEVAE